MPDSHSADAGVRDVDPFVARTQRAKTCRERLSLGLIRKSADILG